MMLLLQVRLPEKIVLIVPIPCLQIRLDNVEIEIDAPFNWEYTIQPKLIPDLEISEEKRVSFEITPPADISVGRYEFRIKTSCLSNNQSIQGEDKTVTVEIQAKTNLAGTGILVFLILGVILSVVVFGIKLSRK